MHYEFFNDELFFFLDFHVKSLGIIHLVVRKIFRPNPHTYVCVSGGKKY